MKNEVARRKTRPFLTIVCTMPDVPACSEEFTYFVNARVGRLGGALLRRRGPYLVNAVVAAGVAAGAGQAAFSAASWAAVSAFSWAASSLE